MPTLQLHKLINSPNRTMEDFKFMCEDTILVLDFLTKLAEECDVLNVS